MPPTYTEQYVHDLHATIARLEEERDTLRDAFSRSGPGAARDSHRIAELTRERDAAVLMCSTWRRACNDACRDLDDASGELAEAESLAERRLTIADRRAREALESDRRVRELEGVLADARTERDRWKIAASEPDPVEEFVREMVADGRELLSDPITKARRAIQHLRDAA